MKRWSGPAAPALCLLVLAASTLSASSSLDSSELAALRLIGPALDVQSPSDEVWPSWDISDTPVLLLSGDEQCLLLQHPRPPSDFRRLPRGDGVETTVYAGERDDISPPLATVGRHTTAVVTQHELEESGPGLLFQRAFLAHDSELCPEAIEPLDLLVPYPVDARSLVLSDIECEILLAAENVASSGRETAAVESLAREFVSIRTYRRILMGPRFAEYERRLEMRDGVSMYVAGRMLERAQERHGDPVFSRAVADCRDRIMTGLGDRPWCADPGTDFDWYRTGRFGVCGASICRLLDSTVPDWKERVREDCVDPYSILEERFRLEAPRPRKVTGRYDFDARLEERAAFAEAALTPAERRFDELTKGDSLRFCINTHLLSNVSVSFERRSMQEVDRHRQVHERILRLEFSGTTRLELVGRPCAVIVEHDAYDVRQVIFPAPEEYVVTTASGRRVELTNGIHEIDEPHRVDARGLLLEAERTVVFVSDERITFVIHR